MQIAKHAQQLRQRVLLVGLLERHLAFWIGVVAKHVGNLLEDENNANGRQQALDHAGGEEPGEGAGLGESKTEL